MRVPIALGVVFLLLSPVESRRGAGELLYNGIVLPSPWPPNPTTLPTDPVTPYYLVHPPSVIPIDVGRQLFVDDFLVSQTTLTRTYHRPTYYAGNPVLKADQSWETGDPMAMPYSDGIWFDPKDKLFKLWYMGGYDTSTCQATSTDGIHWTKPSFDVNPGTNIVHTGWRDSATAWIDQETKDPSRRFVLFRALSGASTVSGSWGLATHFSADGIHWSEPPLPTGATADRCTVFWNPYRKVWVYSLRHGWGRPRKRRYWERNDLDTGPMWTAIDEPPYWCAADSQDLPRPDLQVTPELYNLDCLAYESVLLGFTTIWYGQPTTRPKINEVQMAYSRDGWSWVRPDRRAFCGVSEKQGDWNWGNVQSTIGGCLVMGDQLWFYVSGRTGAPTNVDSGGSTGLATLRRDGFASMDAGTSEGTLTTRAIRFSGRYLFVNLDAPAGSLRVEALDGNGQPIAPFTKSNCDVLAGDSTRAMITWGGASDLSSLAGRNVQFRFSLANGRLYSFWVSPDLSGASYGYVGGGGPGFTGPSDTVGDGTFSAMAAPAAPKKSTHRRCGCSTAEGPDSPFRIPLMAAAALILSAGSRRALRQ
jgi:MYXO-CTERM domain-containing protein